MTTLKVFDPIGWEQKKRELDQLHDKMLELLEQERALDEFSMSMPVAGASHGSNQRRHDGVRRCADDCYC